MWRLVAGGRSMVHGVEVVVRGMKELVARKAKVVGVTAVLSDMHDPVVGSLRVKSFKAVVINIGSIDFYHFIPLSLILTLASGHMVSAKQILLASLFCTLFN